MDPSSFKEAVVRETASPVYINEVPTDTHKEGVAIIEDGKPLNKQWPEEIIVIGNVNLGDVVPTVPAIPKNLGIAGLLTELEKHFEKEEDEEGLAEDSEDEQGGNQ